MQSSTSSGATGRDTSPRTTRIIFLHHSVGADLLKDGHVREQLRSRAPSIELWDHAYNTPRLRSYIKSAVIGRSMLPSHYYGLRDGSGRRVGAPFTMPGDNTDPDGFAALFAEPVTEPPSNTLSHLMRFDVIAFKSCFTILPHLRTDAQLERYKRHYRAVAEALGRYPGKLFIPITPPPLRASHTNEEQTARARHLATWMMSEGFGTDRPNVVPFDLFDTLAAPEGGPQANTLRSEFCRAEDSDTHPNATGGEQATAELVPFLVSAVERVRGLREAVVGQ
jgi:hypothetical protein